jgi:[ribosomal protein S18]-alanine N-acetyltransferase
VSWEITPLPPGAAEPLAILHGFCFPEEPWDGAAFERLMALPGAFGCLAWNGETPVGFALARDLGGETEMLSLGVVPKWRRRGVGRALLGAVIAEAKRRGAASVVLEVAVDNQAACRLYAGAGFVGVGRRPRYYRRAAATADALILRRGGDAVPPQS